MINDLKYGMLCIFISLFLACSTTESDQSMNNNSREEAKVTAVECKGQPNNYTISVTIESPDTGCDQYADWWEVFYPDSTLIYRRILTHSHVNEQPFTRSGGIVDVGPDEFIYVRAHMNNLGYGSQVFSGNVRDGLVKDSIHTNYAATLAMQAPLPDGCDF